MPKSFFGMRLHQLSTPESAVKVGMQNSMIDEMVNLNNYKRDCA